MSERHSGWYDDPDDPTQLRYWDGILWSERRMPKMKPGLDGSRIGTPSAYDDTTATSDQPPQAQPGQHNPYGPQQQQQPPGGGPQQHPQPWQQPRQAMRPTTPDGQRVSGWWRRFAAWLIDSIIVGVVAAVVSYPWVSEWMTRYQSYAEDMFSATSRGDSIPEMPQNVAQLPVAWLIAMVVVYAVYEVGFLVWRGRTIGKVITGISVRPVHEARKPTLDEAIRRFGIKGIATILNPIPLLSGFGTLFTIIDGLWPIGDKGNQAIHDKVASTVVVIGQSTGDQPQPTYPPQAG